MTDDKLEQARRRREALVEGARRYADRNWLLTKVRRQREDNARHYWARKAAARECDLLLRRLQAALSIDGVDTIGRAKHAGKLLLKAISAWHGRDAACRIHTEVGTEFAAPSASQRRQFKNMAILERYDSGYDSEELPTGNGLRREPNVQRLALALATENKTLPKAARWGPRGTTNPMTMGTHIRRLIKARKAGPKRKE
jgi:hypothetical protein